MPDTILQTDIEAIIKKAQARPGVSDLMMAYGRYDVVMEQHHVYTSIRNEPYTVLSNHSS